MDEALSFSPLGSYLWELLTQTLIRQTPTTGASALARTFPHPIGAPMGAGGRSPSWRRWWSGGGLLIPPHPCSCAMGADDRSPSPCCWWSIVPIPVSAPWEPRGAAAPIAAGESATLLPAAAAMGSPVNVACARSIRTGKGPLGLDSPTSEVGGGV